jgi:hypothetical protein
MEKLTPAHFSFKCPMKWDEMEVSGDGRHCSKCRKHVHDLTNCTIDEVIALQRRHGPICGSIKLAVAAVSLSAAACNEPKTQARMLGTPLAHPPAHTQEEMVLPGTICPPDQLEKMKKQ